MFTANMIVCHLVGDYVLQSEWMALNKSKNSYAAFVHVVMYALPFLFLSPSATAMFIIISTHFLIDRFKLARYVVWLKNFIGNGNPSWKECEALGFAPGGDTTLKVVLLIIVDNILHILINGVALTYF